MATSVAEEQAPAVKAVVAEPQIEAQPERQAEPQEAPVAAPSEPMGVNARPEEPKEAEKADKTPAAIDQPQATDVVMAEADDIVAKREPAVESVNPAEETPTRETPPAEANAKPVDATTQRDEEMPPVPEVEAAAAETPARVVESAEETRRRVIERTTQRLKIQLEFVENARRKVLDETHPDMAVQLANLSRERKRMEEIARLRAEQFEHGTSVIFAYECDEANSEFEMQCEKLRQEMLEEIHNEMEIINDQRKGAAASGKLYSCCEGLRRTD